MKKFFYTFILMLAALMVPATATADGYVRGDATGDGVVNMDDLTTLINYLVFGVWPSDDSHEWVDLGLPSGTLWATCNVGASAPEEYGDYFAWGETAPKDDYSVTTYQWMNSDNGTMILTKYNTKPVNGTVDNKLELDSEDDAACVNWGEMWRMPTRDQLKELSDNCTHQLTELNGVYGILVTGPNGNTMFLPAAGYRWDDSLEDVGSSGYYWSRTLYSSDPDCACALGFDSVIPWGDWFDLYRFSGRTVRPVRVPQN